jgi:hypothetical protein
MAHFAKLNENNTVLEILAVNNDVITINGNESETAGIEFLAGLTGHSKWVQTSYNNSFRKRFATIGGTYNESKDVFLPLKEFGSWTLDEETLTWKAPVNKPSDNKRYAWFEPNKQWIEVTND